MNERILELMKKAEYAEPELAGRAKKLVELILQECVTICEKIGDQGLDGHYCADEISRVFK